MKISFTEAAASCDKAEKELDKLESAKLEKIIKINSEYDERIRNATSEFNRAKNVLAKMVAPKPAVKKPASRPVINKEQ